MGGAKEMWPGCGIKAWLNFLPSVLLELELSL